VIFQLSALSGRKHLLLLLLLGWVMQRGVVSNTDWLAGSGNA
jgi:hypothetical protein